ncbi:MAG: hypothetical protein KDD62_16175, partial [Bdellovibrionales bacterium]|nr:hypothetical protein [Bdellovibrionales bacterium]
MNSLSASLALQLDQEFGSSAVMHLDTAIEQAFPGFDPEFSQLIENQVQDKLEAIRESAERTRIAEQLSELYRILLQEERSLEELRAQQNLIAEHIDKSNLSETSRSLLHEHNDSLFCETIVEQINTFARDDLTEDIDYRGFEVFFVYDSRASATDDIGKYLCISVVDPETIRERSRALCEEFPEFSDNRALLEELQHASERLGRTRSLLWQERFHEQGIQAQMQELRNQVQAIGIELSQDSQDAQAHWVTTQEVTLAELTRVTFALDESISEVPTDFMQRLINENQSLAEYFQENPEQDLANFVVPVGTNLTLETSILGLEYQQLLLAQSQSSLRQVLGFARYSFPELSSEAQHDAAIA